MQLHNFVQQKFQRLTAVTVMTCSVQRTWEQIWFKKLFGFLPLDCTTAVEGSFSYLSVIYQLTALHCLALYEISYSVGCFKQLFVLQPFFTSICFRFSSGLQLIKFTVSTATSCECNTCCEVCEQFSFGRWVGDCFCSI